jgi:hypothetical protein
MIINEKMIKDIFSLKIKLSGKDKIKLSEYEEYIPMYDIYSQQIYPIFKKNLHYRLIESHYRFITDEIKDWIENKYNEFKKDKNKSKLFKKNLEIIDNYDLKVLIETSYKVLYKYSKLLGLQISICKRKSFNPYIKHLKPYYSKNELIKLGENMGIIKENIDLELLNDKETHYNICKKISTNDVSFDEIKDHTENIINNNIISWITFYSFYGSFIFNFYLRVKDPLQTNMNTYVYDGLKLILNAYKNSSSLKKDYIFYRFLWDDSFIKNLLIGTTFYDNGFTSTTRDPFYSPGLNGTFGLILMKIHIPKNVRGVGYFIENFSLFPNEEEFLIPPFSKFKLISKDNNFKYFHTNPEFEKLITKKYEVEYISTDYNLLSTYSFNDITKTVDLENYLARGINKLEMIKNFIEKYNKFIILLNKKKYTMYYQWFDGTENSSYSKLYGNKTKEGINFTIFSEDGYPYLNIELGDQLIVNYINTKYFYQNTKQELNNEHIDLIFHFGKVFQYREAKIYHTYRNFSEFIKNYDKNLKIFLFNNLYNHTMYDYIKNKNKEFNSDKYIKYELGWYNFDNFINKLLPESIINKFNLKFKTIGENIIDIIENNFSIYNNYIYEISNDKDLIMVVDKTINLLTQNYFIYNIYNRVQYEYKDIPYNINYSYSDNIKNTFYDLIYEQPVRRF